MTIRWVELEDPGDDEAGRYPFTLPVVAALRAAGRLTLGRGVTFLVGENGTGKSTLVEAIAVAAGFNAEGGTINYRFATRSTESSLGGHLKLVRSPGRHREGFFLRAESFYNVATEMERLGLSVENPRDGGGDGLHERSHGEAFLDLATHRFRPNGLYLLDEPEAALSVRGCLALVVRMADLVAQGCQFVVATHSPVLLAVPGAHIVQIEEDGSFGPVGYDDALPVALTRQFLADPGRYLRQLFDGPG